MLKLLRQWLRAGVMEDGRAQMIPSSGTPQGGVISPLLSNIYLYYLDDVWTKRCAEGAVLVRYADDFVVMCKTATDCEEAERRVRILLAQLKLELHPEKTRRVELSRGKQGFDFLGCHLRKRMSGPIWMKERRLVYFLQRWPSQRNMSRIWLAHQSRSPPVTMSRGSARRDRFAQSRARRVGKTLPNRQCLREIPARSIAT